MEIYGKRNLQNVLILIAIRRLAIKVVNNASRTFVINWKHSTNITFFTTESWWKVRTTKTDYLKNLRHF